MELFDLSSLEVIAEQIRAQKCCKPSDDVKNPVPGEGNPNAEIMFIGEAPGFHEDQVGRPFVGNAGKFLTEMIQSIGYSREDVFITNIVKCRPPDNRDPFPEEIEACRPFLEGQIKLINPLLIVCLGRHSLNYFLPDFKISAVHGQPKHRGERYILPLYHPAAALHNGSLRQTLLDDFQIIPAVLNKIKSIKENERTDKITSQSNQKEIKILKLID